MSSVVLINGKKISKISVFDRGVQFGDGIFETCLIKRHRLLSWSRHFSRLNKGCSKLKINQVDESLWIKDITKALSISKLENAVVKIILSRGESMRGYGFSGDIVPTRIVIVSSLSKLPEKYSLSLCDSGYATNRLLSEIKHCNRLEQVLARVNMSTQECIMLDDNGYVISVTQGNIFAVNGDVILTPSLDECGIEGTVRSAIFDLAESLDLRVEVSSLSVQELLEADEVFISNSIIGIKAVNKINEQLFDTHIITNNIKNKLSLLQKNESLSIVSKPINRLFKSVFSSIVVLALFWTYLAKDVQLEEVKIYQLSSGSSANSVATDLEDLGYIKSSILFLFIAKALNLDSKIKSGYYELTPDMSIVSLIDNFSSAKVATAKVTLVEGRTIKQYYKQLVDNKLLKSNDSFESTMSLLGLSEPYDGYFWPDTYQVSYGDSVLSVLKRANKIMLDKLDSAWSARADNHPLKSKSEALVLASLIEKETANAQEKDKISGVFINRLKKGMRLQTDPTVVYALGDKYQGALTRRSLGFNSPYNTYKNKGLPPGPISSVGNDSLYAAMHPASIDELYFVAKKDGTHAFAKTYKQHLHNINKYLKNL